jgi:hypothetical protein
MTIEQFSLSDVRYNPANGCFEARVTLRSDGQTIQYGCQVSAPITTGFERSAALLRAQALKLHAQFGTDAEARPAGKATIRQIRSDLPPARVCAQTLYAA